MGLYVKEVYENETEGYTFGESDVYETWADEVGELFRAMVREYGRCTGKVYVDREGGPVPVGWHFVKRMQYEDAPETYLRGVWVTVHDAPDTVTRTEHLHAIG